MSELTDKCSRCHLFTKREANDALPMHPCPYQHEINDNAEDYCTCCDECTAECAWDI